MKLSEAGGPRAGLRKAGYEIKRLHLREMAGSVNLRSLVWCFLVVLCFWEREPYPLVLYGLYLVFLGLSFRRFFKAGCRVFIFLV